NRQARAVPMAALQPRIEAPGIRRREVGPLPRLSGSMPDRHGSFMKFEHCAGFRPMGRFPRPRRAPIRLENLVDMRNSIVAAGAACLLALLAQTVSATAASRDAAESRPLKTATRDSAYPKMGAPTGYSTLIKTYAKQYGVPVDL